ncbi:hypothetical protein ACEN88_30425 [Massilia sp. CT11-108]|uniref:hypothetical protein n=1 Tax=Massilia sp. CT11-108 TaxID=3393900 RepID=UPI0039A58751
MNAKSTTIGVGNPTSGEEGSTLTHETMAETGGSGTQPRPEEEAPLARRDPSNRGWPGGCACPGSRG